MERRHKAEILKDLDSKVVFITGPRQVGKTWLALNIAKEFTHPVYLNYDNAGDRHIMETEGWLTTTDLLVLDELHKMPNWKRYLKGVFDTRAERLKIIVTGSARLDYFRKTGDSLAGRFFTHRLFPFSAGELAAAGETINLDRLMNRGGFPEPFLTEDETHARRWRNQYVDGLIREDVLDFERISDFKALSLCLEILRGRTGSPISYVSIARDIGIAPNTVKKFIQIFEALYIIFRVTPFSGGSGGSIARSLLKEPKIYFYDTALVDGDEGTRFENLAALALAKEAAAAEDLRGVPSKLQYLRTKDGLEVDFCYVSEGKIRFLAEAKLSDSGISKNLYYFCRRYHVPGIQVVRDLKRERRQEDIEVRSAEKWLAELD
jgi:predicted AAA+ superfamily ATPase